MSELKTVSTADGFELNEQLIRFEEDYSDPEGTRLVIAHEQDIPDDWVSDLKRQKIDPNHSREGEFMHFATIPVVFWEQMIKEGVDVNRASAKDIVGWLRKKQLDAFITTNKRV
jgi:hypothetical protein